MKGAGAKQKRQWNKQSNLSPPPRFAEVEDGVYRSAFPTSSTLPFLRTLNLKTIIYLCPEPYPEENKMFLEANRIDLFQFAIDDNDDSCNSRDTFIEALKVLMDARNHPLLIHCIVGKHRTGTLVACLRKLQNWPLPRVVDEYKLFAGSKWKETDVKFIEKFEVFSEPLPEENAELLYVFGGRGEQALWRHKIEGNGSEFTRSILSFQFEAT